MGEMIEMREKKDGKDERDGRGERCVGLVVCNGGGDGDMQDSVF